MVTGELDEALLRLHGHGPEFNGYLSNHGPMVVEALWRHGRTDRIHRWTDGYLQRLDDAPATGRPFAPQEWRSALGDPHRAADWIAHMRAELGEHPWPEVLALWWPRLLPGIAAGATHGVIRVGHAVSAVRQADTAPRVDELAHALAYWGMRWQPVPIAEPAGRLSPSQVLSALPVVADQSGGIRDRLAQLPDTPGFVQAASDLAADTGAPEGVPAELARVVDAAVSGYAGWAPGNATMLVHAATAPNAVLMTLPSLPSDLWAESFTAAWSATAAVIAAYRPATAAVPMPGPSAEDMFDVTVAAGSEHMIKFADTAQASYLRTGDPAAMAAIGQAVRLEA